MGFEWYGLVLTQELHFEDVSDWKQPILLNFASISAFLTGETWPKDPAGLNPHGVWGRYHNDPNPGSPKPPTMNHSRRPRCPLGLVQLILPWHFQPESKRLVDAAKTFPQTDEGEMRPAKTPCTPGSSLAHLTSPLSIIQREQSFKGRNYMTPTVCVTAWRFLLVWSPVMPILCWFTYLECTDMLGKPTQCILCRWLHGQSKIHLRYPREKTYQTLFCLVGIYCIPTKSERSSLWIVTFTKIDLFFSIVSNSQITLIVSYSLCSNHLKSKFFLLYIQINRWFNLCCSWPNQAKSQFSWLDHARSPSTSILVTWIPIFIHFFWCLSPISHRAAPAASTCRAGQWWGPRRRLSKWMVSSGRCHSNGWWLGVPHDLGNPHMEVAHSKWFRGNWFGGFTSVLSACWFRGLLKWGVP